MMNIPSYTQWLLGPYIDLSSKKTELSPLHLWQVEISFDRLKHKSTLIQNLQRILPPSFRTSLLSETGLNVFNVLSPLEIQPSLRNERMNLLCKYLDSWKELNKQDQANLLKLLSSLGFYQLIINLTDNYDASKLSIFDELSSYISFIRTSAKYVMSLDYKTPYSLEDFKILALNSPESTIVRFNSTLHMVVQSARFNKDGDSVVYWAKKAKDSLNRLQKYISPFEQQLLLSRFYRGVSFAPMLKGDKDELIYEMNEAEKLARGLRYTSNLEKVLYYENLHPLLESRSKEALWLDDLDLAEERSREVYTIDPLDPKASIELGQILIKKHKIEEALECYRRATHIGPPGTAIAWFMAGQCYEHLKNFKQSFECYLSALKIDPLGISSYTHIITVANILGDTSTMRWAQSNLEQINSFDIKQRQLLTKDNS